MSQNDKEIIEQIDSHLSLIKKNREKILYSILGGLLIGLFSGSCCLWLYDWNFGIFVYGGIFIGGVFGTLMFRPNSIRVQDLPQPNKNDKM